MIRVLAALPLSASLFLVAAVHTAVIRTAAAQTGRWSVPEHGVLLYDEAIHMECRDRDGGRWSGGPSMSTVCAPLLFADELQDGRQLAWEPWSLWSLGAWLACDLTTLPGRGQVDYRWSRVEPYGEVRFVGKAAPLAADGWVGSSRVDLQACKLEYSIVSPK